MGIDKTRNITAAAFTLTAASALLAGCFGGSSGGGGGGDDDAPFEGNLSGQLTAPNGSTPIPDATVYIPDDGTGAASFTASAMSNGQTTCPEPQEANVAWSCTDSQGNFDFAVDLEAGTAVTLKAVKGKWSLVQEMTLDSASTGTLSFSNNPDEGAANIAVVTGSFDNIENVLAKIGMGEMGTVQGMAALQRMPKPHSHGHDHGHSHGHGHVHALESCEPSDFGLDEWPDDDGFDAELFCEIYAGEDFDFDDFDDFDENFSSGELELGTETFSLYNGGGFLPEEYPDVHALFDTSEGEAAIFGYDIVYINCGATSPSDPNWQTTVQEYVNQGGVLYVTDLSRNYVTGPFSNYVAEKGSGSGTQELPGTVTNAPLADWLDGVECVDGDCIAGDDEIQLTGLAGGWALLNPQESSEGDGVETLVQADVSELVSVAEGVEPMTMRFSSGDGMVIFSSYHTAGGFAGSGDDFLPQERILEYLFYSNVD